MKPLVLVVMLAFGCSSDRVSSKDGGVGGGAAMDASAGGAIDAGVAVDSGGGPATDASTDLRQNVPDLSEARDAAGGGAACVTAADCRLFSSDCGGCHCIPLGKNDPDPVCMGGMVNCFLDPCLDPVSTAGCMNGRCVVVK